MHGCPRLIIESQRHSWRLRVSEKWINLHKNDWLLFRVRKDNFDIDKRSTFHTYQTWHNYCTTKPRQKGQMLGTIPTCAIKTERNNSAMKIAIWSKEVQSEHPTRSPSCLSQPGATITPRSNGKRLRETEQILTQPARQGPVEKLMPTKSAMCSKIS